MMLIAGCAGAPADHDAPPVALRTAYHLGSGDRVRVQVFDEEDLSGEMEVDGTGALSMKLIGRVDVGNKTPIEAEGLIAAKLREGYVRNPRVNLEVVLYRPFFILGEIEKPGSYPFVNGITVGKAAAIAGGFSYRAARGRITITRNLTTPSQELEVTEQTRIFPGDLINVPERWF